MAPLILIGYNSINKLYEKIGLNYKNEFLVFDDKYETNMKNIYVFGSLMNTFNDNTQKPNNIFIHNGNEAKLNKIITDVKNKLN